MQMASVMMSTTMKHASLMEEIALDPVIRVGLLMGIVMISIIILTAPLMVEIAVALLYTHNTAQNVYVLSEEEG